MLFFRSEEQIRDWCKDHSYAMAPPVNMTQLWGLAKKWYSTRLLPESRRPKPEEIRGIFATLGLEGNFWDPLSDRFH